MKILHILKSEPDATTRTLMELSSQGHETTEVPLYEEGVDYDRLVDLIFEYDKVITWW